MAIIWHYRDAPTNFDHSFFSEILTPYSNGTCAHTGRLPSFHFILFFTSFDAVVFFSRFGSVILLIVSLEKKRRKERQAASVSIRVWIAPCQNFKSKFVALMGAWPISRFKHCFGWPSSANLAYEQQCLAGPGRICNSFKHFIFLCFFRSSLLYLVYIHVRWYLSTRHII